MAPGGHGVGGHGVGGRTVSVALCTHNGERFIAEQVTSILSQSVPPTEIVLSDDASTDATITTAENTVVAWRLAHPGVAVDLTVLRNAVPLGVTGNFEQAIAATTGDFIALSDQDDVWHPGRVERALSVFEKRPELTLVHSDARLVDADGLPIGDSLFSAFGISPRIVALEHDGRAFEILARRTIVTGAATMIRRSLAETAMPFPAGWVHDEWLAIVAAARGELDVIDEQLVDYRQHGGNEIGAGTLSFLDKVRRIFEPGAERNRRMLVRAEAIARRFAVMHGIDERAVRAAVGMHDHERVRSSLTRRRLLRLGPVLRELRTGRYSAYGRGPADAVRDLIQPL